MKKFILLALVSLFIVPGTVLAHQTEGQKDSSKQGMMQQMMGGEEAGNGMSGMEGMMKMMGMMGRMNEMMDQCTAMMSSDQISEDVDEQKQ